MPVAVSPMPSIPILAPGTQSYCLFRRGGLDFALPLQVAGRAVPTRPLTRLPFAPPDLCGVFLDQRRIVPLLRLDRWLGLPADTTKPGGVWLLIDDGNVRLAALVDRLLGVSQFASRDVKRALAHPVACGMAVQQSRAVVLLDAARLIPTITGSVLAALPQRMRAA